MTKKKVKVKTKTVKKKTVKRKTTAKAKIKIRKNYVMMVLDESGSMASLYGQAIGAFNEQIQTVKNAKGDLEVSVSLVKFANEAQNTFVNEPIDKVPELTMLNYRPNGGTAMYDGVGRAIELLKLQPDINDPDVTVLMLIISDGEENSSKIFKATQIGEMIKQLQTTGRWTFTYAGANQDLTKIKDTLFIPQGNMLSFDATPVGMAQNNSMRSVGTESLYASYAGGQSSVMNFYGPAKTSRSIKKP